MIHKVKIPPNHNWTYGHKPDSDIKSAIYLVMILAIVLTLYILIA